MREINNRIRNIPFLISQHDNEFIITLLWIFFFGMKHFNLKKQLQRAKSRPRNDSTISPYRDREPSVVRALSFIDV